MTSPTVKSVFVVEDDKATSWPLWVLFKARGYHVRVVHSIADAGDQLDAGVGWLVLDLNLPDGRGEDLIGYVRAHWPQIKIVVVTGVTNPARLEAVRALGPDTLLEKPAEFKDLLAAFGLAARA